MHINRSTTYTAHTKLGHPHEDRRRCEELLGANVREDPQRLAQAIDALVLVEHLREAREGDDEADDVHVFEALDPLAALGALPADVADDVIDAVVREPQLDQTRGFGARAEHVVLRHLVVVLGAHDGTVEEVVGFVERPELGVDLWGISRGLDKIY